MLMFPKTLMSMKSRANAAHRTYVEYQTRNAIVTGKTKDRNACRSLANSGESWTASQFTVSAVDRAAVVGGSAIRPPCPDALADIGATVDAAAVALVTGNVWIRARF